MNTSVVRKEQDLGSARLVRTPVMCATLSLHLNSQEVRLVSYGVGRLTQIPEGFEMDPFIIIIFISPSYSVTEYKLNELPCFPDSIYYHLAMTILTHGICMTDFNGSKHFPYIISVV